MVKSWYFILIDRSKGTKDAFLRPLLPHISDSLFNDSQEGIFQRFSSPSIHIALTIFRYQLITVNTICYPL